MLSDEYRVGLGHDTHRIEAGRRLMLGGVHVPFDRGLAGHSDADVLLHAITDALLGAAGLGDIGEAFPDTDPAYAEIDSAILLRRSHERVGEAGWSVVNVDATVHAQLPKLSPHKPEMKQRIAEILRLSPDRVNVKAKTGERVGPVGTQQAMTAEAIVLLKRCSDV
jgi:2-C-methyl-D-erythritol 2,4-cyclodiphosphate synthase